MIRWLAFSILLAPTTVFASDAPVVAIVGLHQPDVHLNTQTKVVESLADALNRSKKAKAVSGSDFAVVIAGRESIILEDALFLEGKQQLTEGVNLFNQAEPEAALPILQRAIESLKENAKRIGSFTSLWDAYIALGNCHLTLENEDDARRAFQDAVALNSVRTPDPALFPPTTTETYNQVRSESLKRSFTVRLSAAEPLSVDHNGAVVGKTPLSIAELVPGTHFLRGTAADRVAFTEVRVQSDTDVLLVAKEPALTPGSVVPARKARETTALYRALGRLAEGVDFLLLAGTDADTLHLQLYDVASDTFSKPTSAPYAGQADDEARTVLPLLLNLLDDGQLPDSSTQASAIPIDRGSNPMLAGLLLVPQDAPEPRNRKRTATIVGAVVGVVVVGAAIGVVTATQGPGYNGRVIIAPF